MKVLVTVGTSSFNRIFSILDNIHIEGVEFFFQVGESDIVPSNYVWACYVDNFNEFIRGFDLVITHAGAGSVFYNLENSISMIVVPNLERVDKHQLELANYLTSNDFSIVCYDLKLLPSMLSKFMNGKYRVTPYIKDTFFKFEEISDYLFGNM